MAFEWLTGSPGRFEQLDLFSPAQSRYQNQMMSLTQPYAQSMGQYYQNLMSGDTAQFNKMMQPYINQFERQTLPGIAERFAGGNAMRSSGFNNSIAQAYTDLGTNMASLGANLQGQGAQGLMGLVNLGSQFATTPQFENIYRPQTPGVLDTLTQAGGQALGGFGQAFGQSYGQNLAKSYFPQPAQKQSNVPNK